MFILKTVFCISAEPGKSFSSSPNWDLFRTLFEQLKKPKKNSGLRSTKYFGVSWISLYKIFLTNTIVLQKKFLGAFFIVEHGDARCYQGLMTMRCTSQAGLV